MDIKTLPQQLDFKGNTSQQIFIEKKHWMKKIQAPKVVAIRMLFGKLKLN